MKYRNKERKFVGSQGEVPSFKISNKTIIVNGYQNFIVDVSNGNLIILKKNHKFNRINEILNGLYDNLERKNKTVKTFQIITKNKF